VIAMTLDETTFQKAWGRAPSAASLVRLRRLQEALGVAENDGLVTIAMVFEFYDDLYRQYPDQCAEAAREAVHDGLASAASLSVAAVQQAIEQGLASLGPRCAVAAKRAVREELAAARVLPSRGGRALQSKAPELAPRRLLGLWIEDLATEFGSSKASMSRLHTRAIRRLSHLLAAPASLLC